MPAASRRLVLPLLALAAVAAPLVAWADAPGVASLRLTGVGKDAATLNVVLTAPAAVTARYGEEPGAWQSAAESSEATDTHELKLEGLAPSRRYFYQLEAGGEALGDIGTFVSGRSWVTRRATIQATAHAPEPSPADDELAERLFAKESDAIVLLSGEGNAEAFSEQYRRAMSDRLVLTGPDSPAAGLTIGDVALGWTAADLAAAKESGGACWAIALGTSAGTSADVVLQGGATSGIAKDGDRLVVTLAGRDSVVLAFEDKALTATLTSALAGSSTATLSRPCAVPGTKKTNDDVPAPDGEPGETSLDGEQADAECDHP